MSVTSWFLVSSTGIRHRLPREMIFVGREDCELMLQSRSVDKQHAVINYDPASDEHLVKDLGSLNGTFVNDLRIPDQTYITLKLGDLIRFGYDPHMYMLEKSEHRVPEEALKHEKYTSQLRMGLKSSDGRRGVDHADDTIGETNTSKSKYEKAERKGPTDSSISRPTPLYGQPSWWGEDDVGGILQHDDSRHLEDSHSEIHKETSKHDPDLNENITDNQDLQTRSIYSYRREPSYFEIPTKEFQMRTKSPETELHEIPTKDTDTPSTVTPPVVQSHASFTIEFDDCTPGKIKIKDHVTKFSFSKRKPLGKDTAVAPTEVMSIENKVADWLVHNDPSIIKWKSPSDDVYSTKSDLPVHIKTLKGNQHEDGTQSDTEDAVQVEQPTKQISTKEKVPPPPELQSSVQSHAKHSPQELLNQQAFVIEFFDDNPRKKRSQSFTNNAGHNDSFSTLKAKLEKRRGTMTIEKSAVDSQHGLGSPQPIGESLKSTGVPQRSSSLKREKTDDRINANTSVVTSHITVAVKPFANVGKKNKVNQNFSSGLYRDSMPEKTFSPLLNTAALLATASPVHSPTHSPSPVLVNTSHNTPLCPFTIQQGETKAAGNEEEDSLSDAGTYTIEAECQDKEMEEPRSIIEQSYGTSSEGGPKWVSRWASLADTFEDSGSTEGLSDNPQRIEVPDRNEKPDHQAILSQPIHHTEFDISHSVRTRRRLPQVPPADKTEIITPSILVPSDSYTSYKIPEKSSKMPKQQEDVQRLNVQDDVDPDSLSDTSKSDEGSFWERDKKQKSIRSVETSKNRKPWSNFGTHQQTDERGGSKAQHTSFYIASEEAPLKQMSAVSHTTIDAGSEHDTRSGSESSSIREKTLHSQESKKLGKPLSLVTKSVPQEREVLSTKDTSVSLVRQESFTKDRPSDDVTVNKLPHISSHSSMKDFEATNPYDIDCQDTQQILKETENTLAVLEARLQSQSSSPKQKSESPSTHMEDSLSGDSDIDTASTVSLVSNKNVPNVSRKKTSVTAVQKDTSSANVSVQKQTSARERLSETRKKHVGDRQVDKTDPTKRFHLRRSSGTRGSLDFTDDFRNSNISFPPDTASSDHESTSRSSLRKKPIIQPLKDDGGKPLKPVVQQGLTRSNSLSAPRPTRASMLRRARLGEASDNEGADTDRTPVNLDGTTLSKAQNENKKYSRLDILAMPRKRTGSFTAPSDTESSTPRNRALDAANKGRKSAAVESSKAVIRRTLGASERQPVSRARSSSAKYSSTVSSRRQQKGSDYTSTSDEDNDSNQSSTKHKRSHASAATQTSRVHGRQNITPQDNEDTDENENDPYQHWSTHSAEIARLSQDLAKDLAILAREIHDVAGDGDAQGSMGTGQNATTTCLPNTPVSTISAREELVQHIPEASLNFQKVPPGSSKVKKELNSNINDSDLSSKHRTWSREEVILDNLMLNPVSQLSHAIRENTEQLAEKMKVMFQSRAVNWEEIEAKINSENEVPILKTSNKEITSILKELRRVQKQLEVINNIIDPTGGTDLRSRGLSSATPVTSVNRQVATAGDSGTFAQGGGFPLLSSRIGGEQGKKKVSADDKGYIV
ncbi:centrosomal protein of 170 kDa protein B isoform X1 [Polypterus senegalus]|uniref:centrosomal protein of 170 kDa protein B isoform X1 n=1 Tax=Polypterus senegalus TaxID=55291 RepID=UPI0019639FE3|nr:centrosomal protein of 170 kDa protein B isoform X1 [Polypterus senegalus]